MELHPDDVIAAIHVEDLAGDATGHRGEEEYRRVSDFFEGDIAAQVKSAMSNGAELLKASGMSLDDAVTSRVLIRDASLTDKMNDAYGKVEVWGKINGCIDVRRYE